MKNNLELGILRRVRIHGGDRGASARATHHIGRKERLMTNETKFSSEANLRTVRKLTIERKIMSTKTTFKRVALIAVASLGLGVLTSVAPANAGAAAWTCTAYVNDPCTQIVGGVATLAFNADAAAVYSVEVTGAVMTNVTDSAGTHEPVGGAADATVTYPTTTVQFTPNAVDDDLTVKLTATSAGTATIKATKLVSGVPSTVTSATITWIASGTNAVSAANSFVTTVTNNTCGAPASPGAAKAIETTNSLTSDYYAAGVAADFCVYTFDGNGNAVTPATVTVYIGKGWVADLTGGTPTASSTGTTEGAGTTIGTLKGDSLQTGATEITAIITDAQGNTITETAPFTWFGKVASIALANNYYANNYAATAATTSIGKQANMIAITAKDKNGTVVPYSAWAGMANTGLATGAATSLIVSSAKGNGSVADDRGESNAFATVTITAADDTAESGVKNGQMTVVCADGKYEKLTITAVGTDPVLATNTLKSNSVDFYCSGAAAKVSVTATGSSVNVSATDANGYPVADGSTVTLAASNGSVVAPSSKTTLNGKFKDAATVIATATSSSSTVTAIVGSVSGTSAAIKGTGTSIEAQVAAMMKLIAKIMKKLGIK